MCSYPEWKGIHVWKWEQRRRVVICAQTGDARDVTSPEGIVLQEPCRYRDGGEVSDRQWRDILGVLKTCRGEIDVRALSDQAAPLAIVPLLTRALPGAGLASA
ncbi:MAG: hypothetical protein IPM29_26415 [Planctomycetes bacterium]|nr:hypothetical protein [Planctomycetota bacterium]